MLARQHRSDESVRALRERLLAATSGPPSASFPISRSGLAFLAALAVIALLTFVVFPVQRIAVVADGATRLVQSREVSDAAIIQQAGLSLEANDRVAHTTDRWGDSQLVISRATPVVAEVSGHLVYWRTQAKTVGGALSEIGVTLDDGDKVLVNGTLGSPARPASSRFPRAWSPTPSAWPECPRRAITPINPLSITVKRAIPFTVLEDGHSLSLRSTEPTWRWPSRKTPSLSAPPTSSCPDPETPLTAGLTAEVDHAAKITVVPARRRDRHLQPRKDRGERARRSGNRPDAPGQGLAGARRAGHATTWTSRSRASPSAPSSSATRYPSGRVFRGDPDLAWGDSRRVEGQDGVHATEYEVTYENGQETGRVLVRDWVEQEPQDATVYYSAGSDYGAAGMPDGLQVVRSCTSTPPGTIPPPPASRAPRRATASPAPAPPSPAALSPSIRR